MAEFRSGNPKGGRPASEADRTLCPVQWLVIREFRQRFVEGRRELELLVAPSRWLVDCLSKKYLFDLFFAVPGRARSCRLLLRAVDGNGQECWRHEREVPLQRRNDGPGSWCVISELEARFEGPGMHRIELYLDGRPVGAFHVEVLFGAEGEQVLRDRAWEYDGTAGAVAGHSISLPYELPRGEAGAASS